MPTTMKAHGGKSLEHAGEESARTGQSLSKWVCKLWRGAKKWSLSQWRVYEAPAIESEERRLRSRGRWEAARMRDGEPTEEWIARFGDAMDAGLRDPWEYGELPRIGAFESIGLGWVALVEGSSCQGWLERSAAGAKHNRWVDPTKEMEQCMAGWGPSKPEKRGGARLRAKWLLMLSQDQRGMQRVSRGLEGLLGKWISMAIMLPMLVPSIFFLWTRAAMRARSQRGDWVGIQRQRARQARSTVAEAQEWLASREERGSGGDQDAVWHWEWAGVSARECERVEASASLVATAATELPPAERAWAAAIWFEAMARVLGGPDAVKFEGVDGSAPRRMFLNIAKGSKAADQAIAGVIRDALTFAGALAFFHAERRSLGSKLWSQGDMRALADFAYGKQGFAAVLELLEYAEPNLAMFAAQGCIHSDWPRSLLMERELADEEMCEIGACLARNPGIVDLASSASQAAVGPLAILEEGHPLRRSFEAAREALAIDKAVGIKASVNSEIVEPKRARRL